MTKYFEVELTVQLTVQLAGHSELEPQVDKVPVLKHFRYVTGLDLIDAKKIIDLLYASRPGVLYEAKMLCVFDEAEIGRLLAYPMIHKDAGRMWIDKVTPYFPPTQYFYNASRACTTN